MAIFRREPANWGKNPDIRPISAFSIDHCWTSRVVNVAVYSLWPKVCHKMADTGNRFVIASQILTPQAIFYQ